MGVRMTHPISSGEYTAAASQVPFLKQTGWEVAPGQDEQGDEWPAEMQRFEGQPRRRMRHAGIEEEITVAESAVPYHQEREWVIVEDKPEDKPEQVDESADDGLDELTVAQLQDEIRAINKVRSDDAQLPVSGTKAELLERVRTAPPEQAEADAAQADTESEE